MANELPADLNRWPDDPFELLNVDRSADARTARRAYFRLIRTYKPDKFPGEFQKIHEAHESVQQWLRWNQPSETDETEQADSLDAGVRDQEITPANPFEQDNGSTNHESESAPMSRAGQSGLIQDPFEQFHQKLEAADIPAAFATINSIDPAASPSHAARASLTKYYLARFFPNAVATSSRQKSQADSKPAHVRAASKRIAWLLQTLANPEFYYPAFNQLRAEFEADRSLALSKPVGHFLETCEDTEKLDAICRLRWQALGHDHWKVVVKDFRQLKQRSLFFGRSWERLMAESMEHTLWHDLPICQQHNQECWDEISQMHDGWAADTVELLILAVEQWKRLSVKEEWVRPLPTARNSLTSVLRQHWLPVAQSIAADRTASFAKLNRLYQSSSIAMSVFESGLQSLAMNECESTSVEDWSELNEQVACFFHDAHYSDYTLSRRAIADFCIENHLDPTDFAHAASSFQNASDSVSWNSVMRNDGPLLCLYYAGRIADAAS